ncbi:MAG: hypothetical protein HEP70_13985 [Rhodobiaceae bacterium]|nr:hypothetical protein [Rhodobiaceae bacterium]
MLCDQIRKALSILDVCEETESGSRVVTQCLYPSFDPVNVFVVKYGDGFKIHDGGGAARCAWIHGRDGALVNNALSRSAALYHVELVEETIVAEVPNLDWLLNAVLATANASANAARSIVEHSVASAEATLKDRIFDTLVGYVPKRRITKDYSYVGRSGKPHHFDYAVRENGSDVLLMSAVSPHHVSVAAKYVAFSDIEATNLLGRYAVYDRQLDQDDVSLLQQVAEIVPLRALEPSIKERLSV